MKKIFLSLILINSLFIEAQEPCDGPAGCPIYEHIKDEGDHMLEQFMSVAVVAILVLGVGGAAVSASGESVEFNFDNNSLKSGVQIMPLDSKLEINTLTPQISEFHTEFYFNKTSINLLEVKYKFN